MTISEQNQKLMLLKFFSMLFGRCQGGYVEIRPFDLNYNLDFKNRSWLPVENKQKIAKRIWKLRHGHLFYGVATRTYEGKKRNKGTKKYLHEIPALFADLDADDYQAWEEMKEIICDFPFEPSSVIFSGHGLHVYYFLDPPINMKGNVNRVEKILKIIQDKMLKADSTSDSSRILRAPYTANIKDPSKPVLAKSVKLNPITYSLKDFEDQFWELLKNQERSTSGTSQNSNHKEMKETKLKVSARIKRLIETGKTDSDKYKSRSEADMAVITGLLQAGYNKQKIIQIFQENPEGIGEKYAEKGKWGDQYLNHSIEKARRFLSSKTKYGKGQQ